MGYNLTIKSLQKVRTHLDAMVESKASLVWLATNPKKLAYQIQEALKAAEALKFTTYAGLRSKWVVRYKIDRVIAEYQEAPPAEGRLSFEGIIDPLDVVQTVIRHKHIAFDLLFPDYSTENEKDFQLIDAWCRDNQREHVTIAEGLLIKKANGNPQAAIS